MKEPIKLEQLTVWGLEPPQPRLYFRGAKFIFKTPPLLSFICPGGNAARTISQTSSVFPTVSYLARRKQSLMMWWRREKEKNTDFYCRTLKGNTLIVIMLKECEWKWDQIFPWLSFGSFPDSFLTTWKIKPAFYNFNNQRSPTASPINISE